jgi:hypothetical protein
MRLSRYFLPVLKETPKEAEIVSHQLMLRAGMIKQEAAGSYAWLPLGYKVLSKITRIIEEEQNRSGAIQLLMPTLQSAELWRESGRYDDYGKEMLRIKDRHERDMLYGPTNEEMITDIFRTYVKSCSPGSDGHARRHTDNPHGRSHHRCDGLPSGSHDAFGTAGRDRSCHRSAPLALALDRPELPLLRHRPSAWRR